jgi:putative chitinase
MARHLSPLPGSLDWFGKLPNAPSEDEPLVLTGEILLKIVPKVGLQADSVASNLNLACKEAGITTRIGQAMFIAQLAHESAGFTRLQEMGGKTRYTFAKYAEKEADDKEYDYFFFMYDKDSPSPRRQKVAKNLGNENAGDGARYKGRGYIQLTGRSNYRKAGKDLGLELEKEPELAANPLQAARIAAWFWKTRSLNNYANVDSTDNFKEVTRRINGGYRGLEERQKYYQQAKSVLLTGMLP